MPYREFKLPAGFGTVLTRVPDEAVEQWFDAWYEGGGKTTGDRPPDVDTETIRAWVGPNNEKDWDAWKARAKDALNEIVDEFTGPKGWPLATFAVTIHNRVLKVLMAVNPDTKLLQMHVKGTSLATGDNFLNNGAEFPPEAMEDANAMLQHSLFATAELIAAFGEEADWMITLPSDFEVMEHAMEDAKADFDAELKPREHIPWARFPDAGPPEMKEAIAQGKAFHAALTPEQVKEIAGREGKDAIH